MRNILILIDIQKEYTSSNRSFYLKGIHPSLDNCKSLLTKARQLDWSIVHVKHLADESSSTFNPKEEFSQFAVGFEPKQGELVFIKNDRSCFTCKDFKDFIEKHKSDDIYVIGYNTPMCILSTMVYAKNEHYKLILVEDACWAKACDNLSEQQVHENVISVIRGYGYASLIKFADL